MMADLQYNFLNDTFTVYENVETPKKSTILNTPISGNLDIGDWGYVGDNGVVYANNNISTEGPKMIVDNNEEYSINPEFNLEFNSEPQKVNTSNQNLSERKKQAMEFFMSKKDTSGKSILSKHQAAGLVGNLIRESKLNPSALNKTSGAVGIAQWLGSRKKKLISKYGKNPSFEQQLEFVWEELNTTHKRGLDSLKNSQSVREAAANAFGWYEFSVGPKGAIAEMNKYGQDGLKSYNQGIKFAESLLT